MAELRGWWRKHALAALGVVWLSGAAGAQEIARDRTVDDVFNAGVSDAELARESGLGVVTVVDDSIFGDGNFAIGEGNSAAQANSEVSLNGAVEAETVNAGSISTIRMSGVEGMNVFQNNTAPNVNQIVTQAIIIQFVDSPAR